MANITEMSARTALEDLADRALLEEDTTLETFLMPSLTATFLRQKRPEAVMQTGNQLTDRAYALALANGYDKYDLFHTLEEEWLKIDAALLRLAKEIDNNARFQEICFALNTFLDFSGRWERKLTLNKQGEEMAEAIKDFFNAGWRRCEIGFVYARLGQAEEALSSANHCDKHWRKTRYAGAREFYTVFTLRGWAYEAKGDYTAAIQALRQSLNLRQTVNEGMTIAVAVGLSDLADLEWKVEKYDDAERHYSAALNIATRLNKDSAIATYTSNLAGLAMARKRWSEAEALAQEAMPFIEKVGRLELAGRNCRILAKALAQQGKSQAGLPYARRAVAIFTRLKEPSKLEQALAVLEECGG